MSEFALPSTLKFQSFNGPHSMTFVVSASHTAARPHVVIVDRILPNVDPRNGNVTYGRFRVRTIRACVDGGGVVTGRNSLIESIIRFPPEATPADVKADIGSQSSWLGNAGFQDDAVDRLALWPMAYVAP